MVLPADGDDVHTGQPYRNSRSEPAAKSPFPAEMSALLGIGINQYRLYEAGEMPSLSIGKILYALCHNPETLMFYLKNRKK